MIKKKGTERTRVSHQISHFDWVILWESFKSYIFLIGSFRFLTKFPFLITTFVTIQRTAIFPWMGSYINLRSKHSLRNKFLHSCRWGYAAWMRNSAFLCSKSLMHLVELMCTELLIWHLRICTLFTQFWSWEKLICWCSVIIQDFPHPSTYRPFGTIWLEKKRKD